MFNNMFDNIGGKIKKLASLITKLGMIGSVLAGIRTMFAGAFITGIMTIILGSLIFWISSLTLYGFGELIEKTTEIAKNTAKEKKDESLMWMWTKEHTMTNCEKCI